MGYPGSGKTTFANQWCKENNCVHISRDDIRFSLVKEDEDYFSREKEVYKAFVKAIVDNLKAGRDVCADATHVTRASRKKLIKAVGKEYTQLGAIWVHTPLVLAIERNELRKGTRAYVPPLVIDSMAKSFEEPSKDEGFGFILYIRG